MFKAIYLTGTIVAFCFALLWLDVDEMREEMREEERGYYRGFINRNQIQLVAAEVEGATVDNTVVCAQLLLNLADDDAGILIQQTLNLFETAFG